MGAARKASHGPEALFWGSSFFLGLFWDLAMFQAIGRFHAVSASLRILPQRQSLAQTAFSNRLWHAELSSCLGPREEPSIPSTGGNITAKGCHMLPMPCLYPNLSPRVEALPRSVLACTLIQIHTGPVYHVWFLCGVVLYGRESPTSSARSCQPKWQMYIDVC